MPAPLNSSEKLGRSDTLRRFAYFAIGLSIGLLMLGMFQRARRAELARQEQDFQERTQSDGPRTSSSNQPAQVQDSPPATPTDR